MSDSLTVPFILSLSFVQYYRTNSALCIIGREEKPPLRSLLLKIQNDFRSILSVWGFVF